MVEKRKSDFYKKQKIDLLFMELSDLQFELTGHVESYFDYLLKIRTQPELTKSGNLPIPTAKQFDLAILSELYKQIALNLSREQRLAIKRLPNTVEVISKTAQDSVDSILEQKIHCIQSIKNSIKFSCKAIYEINSLCEHRERYQESSLNSNQAVIPVLTSIGISPKDIEASRIEETQFT